VIARYLEGRPQSQVKHRWYLVLWHQKHAFEQDTDKCLELRKDVRTGSPDLELFLRHPDPSMIEKVKQSDRANSAKVGKKSVISFVAFWQGPVRYSMRLRELTII
jgi:hypothetical protein